MADLAEQLEATKASLRAAMPTLTTLASLSGDELLSVRVMREQAIIDSLLLMLDHMAALHDEVVALREES